ncbi:minor capsid protein [Chromobacterium violaceum]|uniref:minor capsid protein n=1 Tax=Chromobacterium violaceum TaxID=536 RepID=UPI001C8B772C|nr:minor capsid protein [Chromobacterium violaceum]MBX9267210.1 minor capsid protein [Chromobacterium violaceum]
MATANEQQLLQLIAHQIDLGRYSSHVVRKIMALLNRADADLFARLQLALADLDADTFTVQRLDAILRSVRQLNRAAYEQARISLEGELSGVVTSEVEWQHDLFRGLLPVQVSVASVAPETAYAAAMARPMQGRLLREWFEGMEEGKAARLRDALRMGFLEGEPVAKIIQRIRGTRAMGYADGLIETDRRAAEAIARTAVNHYANFSRQHVANANSDLIAGVKWVSTLDMRTSSICRSRDGKIYPIDSGPRPPAHMNCRSAVVFVLKSWQELGIDMAELPESTRASLNGQVPEELSYSDWIRQQPATMQDEVLGKTKGQLYRAGGLSLDRFTDASGQEYTLDELRKRNKAAFEVAGLV